MRSEAGETGNWYKETQRNNNLISSKMKKKFMSVALLAVLGTMAVGCQKEAIVEPQTIVAEVGTVRTVSYSVNGVTHRVTSIQPFLSYLT